MATKIESKPPKEMLTTALLMAIVWTGWWCTRRLRELGGSPLFVAPYYRTWLAASLIPVTTLTAYAMLQVPPDFSLVYLMLRAACTPLLCAGLAMIVWVGQGISFLRRGATRG